ncbi:MAG: hypothetical protein JNM17_33645 [Archangium sp.]|nr:hypothetical protein [Archangium sp.]
MMRQVRVVRFELVGGGWRELVLDRTRISVRAGFHTQLTWRDRLSFSSEGAAAEQFDAMSRADPAWPHRTVSERDAPRWDGLQRGAANVELEAALDAADDRSFGAAARVYTDWLLTMGDPLGELAVHLQGDGAAKSFLAEHGEAFFGELDLAVGKTINGLEWHAGLLRAATLQGSLDGNGLSLEQLTEQFLNLPVARFLDRLRFGPAVRSIWDNDWSLTASAVVKSARAPFLRELRFDAALADAREELRWATFGDASDWWKRLPRLEWLVLAGNDGDVGEIDLPALQRFERVTGALSAEELSALARAKWPRLERLELSCGRTRDGATATADQFRLLLDNPMPGLTHLCTDRVRVHRGRAADARRVARVLAVDAPRSLEWLAGRPRCRFGAQPRAEAERSAARPFVEPIQRRGSERLARSVARDQRLAATCGRRGRRVGPQSRSRRSPR